MTPAAPGGEVPLRAELDAAVEVASSALGSLRDARILITGGTGFIGSWLLELLLRAEEQLALGLRLEVVSRDPEAFASRAPHLANAPVVDVVRGDVRTFEPETSAYSHVIHAAAEANTRQAVDDPVAMRDTLVRGAEHLMQVASDAGAKRVLYVSSGIVCGRQPPEMRWLPEDHEGELDPADPLLEYARGKRDAESICLARARETRQTVSIARGFSFVGPYMPLSRVAIGQFIGAGLDGRDIVMHTDGTAVRSYMYAADIAVWLLTVLARGEHGRAYNVGSEREHTLMEVAETVRHACGGRSRIVVEGRETTAADRPRYVPSTMRARSELGLRETVELAEAVERTVRWHQGRT